MAIISKNAFTIVFIAAFLLRLIGINQSLWLDESTTARVVQQYSLKEIITQFSPHDFHPPFYYLFMKIWTSIFGYSEIALRMPSVIASLASGLLIYRMVKWLNGPIATAQMAAAFFLFNPLIVYYSQEARMYAISTLFISLILYYALRVKGLTGFKKEIILVNIFIALSLLTFYGSIFFILSLYLYFLAKKEFKLFAYVLPGTLVAGILLFPLFMTQLQNSREVLRTIPNWSITLGKANLKNLLLIPIKFSIGRISWEPKILYYTIAGIWTLFVMLNLLVLRLSNGIQHPMKILKLALRRGVRVQDDIKPLLYFLVTPIILGFIFSFYRPVLQYFRFIYVIPFLVILLAMNVKQNWQRYILLSGFLIYSLIYVSISIFHREDWKSLVRSIPTSVVYAVPTASDPVKYYSKTIKVRDIRKEKLINSTVIVLPYASEIYGFSYKEKMKKNGYSISSVQTFRNLTYETWTR